MAPLGVGGRGSVLSSRRRLVLRELFVNHGRCGWSGAPTAPRPVASPGYGGKTRWGKMKLRETTEDWRGTGFGGDGALPVPFQPPKEADSGYAGRLIHAESPRVLKQMMALLPFSLLDWTLDPAEPPESREGVERRSGIPQSPGRRRRA